MYCQLDQVKDILDIGAAVRKALLKELEECKLQRDWQQVACAITCGLLVLKDLDVFIQQGVLTCNNQDHQHT